MGMNSFMSISIVTLNLIGGANRGGPPMIKPRLIFLGLMELSGLDLLMQDCSLRGSGTLLIKPLGDNTPICMWRSGKKRAPCAELWEWGQLAFITRPEHVEVLKASHSVSCTFRWLGFFTSQAKMGSTMLPHFDHLNPTTCRTQLLSSSSEGMGSIRSQASMGCTKTGWNFTLAPHDLFAHS
eukprot:1159810-Pelagomonas_calceolata.AAC.24